MEWSIGHSLIVVVALLLGLAAGWLLRGRQSAGVTGRPIVDGDPVAGLAVVSSPEPPATTDEARPAASIDSPPVVVADEPAPVDTVSAPAAVTTSDDSTPNAVDPGDMALTDPPPPVPTAERTDEIDEPVTADEQSGPATVIAPRQPLDDSTDTPSPEATPAETAQAETTPVDTTPTDTTPVDATPVDATPVDATPVDATPVDATPAETSPLDTTPVDATPVDATPAETSPLDTTPVDTTPVDTTAVDTTPAETSYNEATPAGTAPADVDDAEPVRATPPVRDADTTPATAASADTDPTGRADDFRRIQGVGPKMAAALQAAGVRTYGQLGALDEPALRDLIRAAGLRAAPGLTTWPQQARLLAGVGDEAAAVLPGGDQG
ncbi:hypothetical protein [Micromonospora sp. NPDC049102]|uniref:hypothetical protein n=1 Tax=Micromonospora sp. NPDC049102 TaxID=3364265 RepID=UPI00371F15E3